MGPTRGPETRILFEDLKFWQGWKESNLRMPESKSGALTNLATPLHRSTVNNNKLSKTICKVGNQPSIRYF